MSWLTTPKMGALNQSLAVSMDDDDNSSSSIYWGDCINEWPPPAAITGVLTFVYCVIGLIGFIGNFLVVFTIFYKKGQQSVTSMLLCSLAVSDIIVVSMYLPIKLADFLTKSWVLGEVACKLVGYLNLISPACSACMLMVIGLERFIVILYPLRARSFITRSRAKVIVVCTWAVSLILGIPGLVFQAHGPKGGDLTNEFVCYKDYSDKAIKKGYNLYALTILYIIPLAIMGIAYITVSLRLQASAKTSRGMQSMKAPRSSSTQQYIYNKPPADSNRSNGFKPLVPNAVPTSVDDDPFSAASESRYDGGVRGGVPAGAPPVRQRRRKRRPVTLKDRQQVILMLILVVALYAITWGPLFTVSTLFAFGVFDSMCMDVMGKISSAVHIWAFLNSTVNPVVYSFMSRNFRETVKEALRSCCRCFGLGGGQTHGGREASMYYSTGTRCSTTVVTQVSSVKRNRSTSDGNCSPGKGQSIEMSQYSRLPSSDQVA